MHTDTQIPSRFPTDYTEISLYTFGDTGTGGVPLQRMASGLWVVRREWVEAVSIIVQTMFPRMWVRGTL